MISQHPLLPGGGRGARSRTGVEIIFEYLKKICRYDTIARYCDGPREKSCERARFIVPDSLVDPAWSHTRLLTDKKQ